MTEEPLGGPVIGLDELCEAEREAQPGEPPHVCGRLRDHALGLPHRCRDCDAEWANDGTMVKTQTHRQDPSKELTHVNVIPCVCGVVHGRGWPGWTERPPAARDVEEANALRTTGGGVIGPAEVIAVVGPIVEGSIVVLRYPHWLEDAEDQSAEEWNTRVLASLERAAGHKRFTVYFTDPDAGGIAVLTPEEVAAAARRHVEESASA